MNYYRLQAPSVAFCRCTTSARQNGFPSVLQAICSYFPIILHVALRHISSGARETASKENSFSFAVHCKRLGAHVRWTLFAENVAGNPNGQYAKVRSESGVYGCQLRRTFHPVGRHSGDSIRNILQAPRRTKTLRNVAPHRRTIRTECGPSSQLSHTIPSSIVEYVAHLYCDVCHFHLQFVHAYSGLRWQHSQYIRAIVVYVDCVTHANLSICILRQYTERYVGRIEGDDA